MLGQTIQYTRPYLYPKQERAIFSGKRWSLCEASTKSGKTVGSIARIIEAALGGSRGQHFWWVAPVSDQARIAYSRIKQNLTEGVFRGYEHPSLRIDIITGPTIDFKSADNPDSLYGEDVYGGVFDEASRAKPEAWHAFRSTLTATRGWGVLIGNVKGRQNWFYEWCRRVEAGKDPNAHYERISWKDAVEAGVLDLEEIEDAQRNLPEQVFRELYEAEASDDGANPFGLQHIAVCIVEQMPSTKPVAFGIDLAKTQDYFVVIGLDEGGNVCVFDRWNKIAWDESINRVHRLIGEDCATLVDSTGLGDPVLAQLQVEHGNVQGFNFSNASKQRIMEGLSVSIQSHEITFPQGPIARELQSFEYATRGGRTFYSAPEGYHDDCVCLIGNTLIRTEHGPVEIKDLTPGVRVLTHKGQYKPITVVGARLANNVHKLEITGRPNLLLTTEHPILAAKRYSHGPHDDIQNTLQHEEEDFLSIDGGLSVEYSATSIAPIYISDIETIDLLALAPSNYIDQDGFLVAINWNGAVNPKSSRVKRHLEIDREFCFLMGYYLAEGSTGGDSHVVQFASHEREMAIRMYVQDVFAHMGLKTREIKTSEAGYNQQVGSKILVKFFRDNFGKKTNKALPKWVEHLPLYKQKFVLAGYLTGDGSFASGQCIASTISAKAAQQIYEISIRLGLPLSIKNRDRNWFLSWGAPTTKRIVDELLPLESRLDKNIKEYSGTKDQTQIRFSPAGRLLGKINSISKIEGEHIVYNISVEDDESYIANNTIVHNCALALARQAWASTAPGANMMEFYSQTAKRQKAIEATLPVENNRPWRPVEESVPSFEDLLDNELTKLYEDTVKAQLPGPSRLCAVCGELVDGRNRVTDGEFVWHQECLAGFTRAA